MYYVFKAFKVAHPASFTEVFGVFRLSAPFYIVVSALSFGMAGSVIRLAGESLATKNLKRLTETMSVARTMLLGAGVVGVALVSVLSSFLLEPLKVPEAYWPAAIVLFRLTALAAAFQLMHMLFRGLLQAKQRYDLANGAIIAEAVVRVGLVVTCFKLGWIGLETLGVGMAGGALCGLLVLRIMTRRILPELKMSFRRMSRSAFQDIFSFGMWTTVNMASRYGLDMVGTPLVSAVAGSGAAGMFNIPQTFASYGMGIVGGLTHTLWPVATGMAARGERDKLGRLYLVGTRLALMIIAPVVAVLVTHGKPFIVYYTSPEMEPVYGVMLVYIGLTFPTVIGLSAEHIILGSGRIVGVSISRLVATVLGVGLAVAVALWTPWGLPEMAAALMFPAAVRGAVVLPMVMRRQVGIGYWHMLVSSVFPATLALVLLLAAGWAIQWLWPPTDLTTCFVQMALTAVLYGAVAWFVVLRSEEKTWMWNMVRLRRAGFRAP